MCFRVGKQVELDAGLYRVISRCKLGILPLSPALLLQGGVCPSSLCLA